MTKSWINNSVPGNLPASESPSTVSAFSLSLDMKPRCISIKHNNYHRQPRLVCGLAVGFARGWFYWIGRVCLPKVHCRSDTAILSAPGDVKLMLSESESAPASRNNKTDPDTTHNNRAQMSSVLLLLYYPIFIYIRSLGSRRSPIQFRYLN